MPIVSFKPKEIFVSVEKLKTLGYDKDIYGNDLVDDSQILELKPHDVLLPCAVESQDERADEVFIKTCNFIDELLVRLYKMEPIYNVKNREDLIGKLGVCMAPHNCAGVVCRFIGFSNTLGLFASPFMHAAVRRDCDGDEAALMLLGDVSVVNLKCVLHHALVLRHVLLLNHCRYGMLLLFQQDNHRHHRLDYCQH